jgi:hypothetical protein
MSALNFPPETPEQRRARCLRRATEAELCAKQATAPSVRENYLRIAKSWRDLGEDIEA